MLESTAQVSEQTLQHTASTVSVRRPEEDNTAPMLEVADVDALIALAPIWDALGFSEVIQTAMPNDHQVRLPSAIAIKALVLNIVCGRDPLYRVSQAWNHRPYQEILGEDVTLDALNDSALARHLDRLHTAGAESVFAGMCLRAIEHEGLCLEQLQFDTTSRLVFGEYKNPEEGAISIAHGHSKDKRPDLKQVMSGIGTTKDGVPVFGQMLDGNTSDKKWHGGVLAMIQKHCHLKPGQPFHYVGDSALITQTNLDIAARQDIMITGRLPRTVNACDEVIAEVLNTPEAMQDLGIFSTRPGAASYRGCVVTRDVLGHTVQLGVYTSSAPDERIRRNVLRRQQKACAAAEKAASKLMRTTFACADDAEHAGQAFIKAHAHPLIRIEVSVQSKTSFLPMQRGRPKKGAQRDSHDTYHLSLSVAANDEAFARAMQHEGSFVILHSGKTPISARDLLRSYKDQSAVETRFPFLKDAAWADVFFVKTPHRLEALGYVILMALLLWSIWERRVRKNLEASKEPPICDVTGMKKKRPTAMVCRHILYGIKIMRVQQGQQRSAWRLAKPLTHEQLRVLRFSLPLTNDMPAATALFGIIQKFLP